MSILNFWLSFNDCAEAALKYGSAPLVGYTSGVHNLLSADEKHLLLRDMIDKIIAHDDAHREKVGTAVVISSAAQQQTFVADKENALQDGGAIIKVSSFQCYEAIAFRLWKYFQKHEPRRKISFFLDRALSRLGLIIIAHQSHRMDQILYNFDIPQNIILNGSIH